jgi:hypothetical protein
LHRLIRFFSLAVMTQVILMLSQLILLPIQVRLWGQGETALWYSALALATMTYFVDCGLRTAGHAELLKANSNPSDFASQRLHFRQIWTGIRILILLVTLLLVAGDFLASWIWKSRGYSGWHALLISACAIETVLIIRITYLDSLGRYAGAEASYFCFAVLRLGLSIPALLVFHWKAAGLASIYLLTAVIALVIQGVWLCRTTPLLQLTDKLTPISWKALSLARHTVAEPIANWVRLSLPVLVIGQIAAPMAVTTYVGFRAVFGAGRTTVQQLARVASVEVLKERAQDPLTLRADKLLSLFTALAICFGTAVSLFVVIDNLRLLGLWLKHFDLVLFQQVALAFALTAPFFAYQIPMNLMFRMGDLARVARRHYGFVAYSLAFGCVAVFARSLPLYLGMLVCAEALLSITFFAAVKARIIRLPVLACLIIFACWLAARHNVGGWFVHNG